MPERILKETFIQLLKQQHGPIKYYNELQLLDLYQDEQVQCFITDSGSMYYVLERRQSPINKFDSWVKVFWNSGIDQDVLDYFSEHQDYLIISHDLELANGYHLIDTYEYFYRKVCPDKSLGQPLELDAKVKSLWELPTESKLIIPNNGDDPVAWLLQLEIDTFDPKENNIFYCEVDGRLVAVCSIAREEMIDLIPVVRVSNVYTVPEYRRNGYAITTILFGLNELIKEETYLFYDVGMALTNIASSRLAEKLGLMKYGTSYIYQKSQMD
ncbi:MAG: hypothetical protein GX020_04230 [Firmicutes bacterium]|nr:hypothetical protein [Bacillota bacterium]